MSRKSRRMRREERHECPKCFHIEEAPAGSQSRRGLCQRCGWEDRSASRRGLAPNEMTHRIKALRKRAREQLSWLRANVGWLPQVAEDQGGVYRELLDLLVGAREASPTPEIHVQKYMQALVAAQFPALTPSSSADLFDPDARGASTCTTVSLPGRCCATTTARTCISARSSTGTQEITARVASHGAHVMTDQKQATSTERSSREVEALAVERCLRSWLTYLFDGEWVLLPDLLQNPTTVPGEYRTKTFDTGEEGGFAVVYRNPESQQLEAVRGWSGWVWSIPQPTLPVKSFNADESRREGITHAAVEELKRHK